MDTSKIYTDSNGDQCSIYHMVRREPEWAANRIQEGEKAIERIAELEAALAKATGNHLSWEGAMQTINELEVERDELKRQIAVAREEQKEKDAQIAASRILMSDYRYDEISCVRIARAIREQEQNHD